MSTTAPPSKTREEARQYLAQKIVFESKCLEDPRCFATTSPYYIIEDAVWRLRWIDCAPEGAYFKLAPLQDKRGIPMGDAWHENIGPGRALREARIRHGLNPFGG